MRTDIRVPRPGDEEWKTLLLPYRSRSSRRSAGAATTSNIEHVERHDSTTESDGKPENENAARLYNTQQHKCLRHRRPKSLSDLRFSLDYTSQIYAEYGVLQHTQRLLVIEVNQYDFERFYLWICSRAKFGRLPVQYANIVFVVLTSPPVPPSVGNTDGESNYMSSAEIEQMFKEGLYWLTLTSYEQPELFESDSCYLSFRWRPELCNTYVYEKMSRAVRHAAKAGRCMQVAGFNPYAAQGLYWQWMEDFVEMEKYGRCLDEVLVLHQGGIDGTRMGRSVALGMPGNGWQYDVVADKRGLSTVCAVIEKDEEWDEALAAVAKKFEERLRCDQRKISKITDKRSTLSS